MLSLGTDGVQDTCQNRASWNTEYFKMKKFGKQVQKGLSDLPLKQIIKTSWEMNLTYVSGIGVLGFPNIESWKKSQENFQRDFTKLMLEYKGSSPKESVVLQTDSGGWLCLAAFISWGQASLCEKASFWRVVSFGGKAGFLYWLYCLVTMFAPTLEWQDARLLIITTQEGCIVVKPWSTAHVEQWFDICMEVNGRKGGNNQQLLHFYVGSGDIRVVSLCSIPSGHPAFLRPQVQVPMLSHFLPEWFYPPYA